MKADVLDDLKALITNRFDEYRVPYGRFDIVSPRHTSFGATCNDNNYLIDTTGNRRWWTVPINRMMSFEEIDAFPAEQLWAQIYAEVVCMDPKEQQRCFRLTREESKALEARNSGFDKPIKGQAEVEDILSTAEVDETTEWKIVTATQFKMMYPHELHNYTAAQIGMALNRCGVEQIRTSKKRGYKLPIGALTGLVNNPF